MTKLTIKNAEHNTATTTTPNNEMRISHARMLRIRRTLCGCTGCSCGANLKERGSSTEHAIVDADGVPYTFIADEDGGGEFVSMGHIEEILS